MKLEAESLKRSTLLKKSKLLLGNTCIGIQLEATSSAKNSSPVVLSRFYIKMSDLVNSIEKESGKITIDSFIQPNKSLRVTESVGFVNNFRYVILSSFYQLLVGKYILKK